MSTETPTARSPLPFSDREYGGRLAAGRRRMEAEMPR